MTGVEVSCSRGHCSAAPLLLLPCNLSTLAATLQSSDLDGWISVSSGRGQGESTLYYYNIKQEIIIMLPLLHSTSCWDGVTIHN